MTDQVPAQEQRIVHALRTLRERVTDLEGELKSAWHGAIAIVGMGCRLPGSIADPDAFWELLRGGRCAVSELPRQRFDFDTLLGETARRLIYTRAGGFIEGVDRFDAAFFGISPREAESIDPQQRLVLQVAWEALEHAGIPASTHKGSATGVFVGIGSDDYLHAKLRATGCDDVEFYDLTGNALNFVAGRLSYLLGFKGPALAVDTACSSSLAAVHLACQSLRRGECSVALAAGVSLMLSPETFVAACRAGLLARDGHCKTFDARADGYVRGEGCTVVVLKRLAAAQAAGDKIYAVIRGSAMGHGGRTSGLTVPSSRAQADVINRALEDAGVAPVDLTYVEAHGTGTPLGDPIEVEALRQALAPGRDADRPLYIGTVKTNLGHLEAAAGLTGLQKVALMLEHRSIPAHLHFEQPNPACPLAAVFGRIPTSLVPWPSSQPLLAGVSAFGASGTNVHVILEGAPSVASAAPTSPRHDLYALPLSAHTKAALRDLAARLLAKLDGGKNSSGEQETLPTLPELAHAAARHRSHLFSRMVLLSPDTPALVHALRRHLAGSEDAAIVAAAQPEATVPRLVFVFSGHGAQWDGMARRLLHTEAVFRQALGEVEEALAPHVDFSVRAELLGPGKRLLSGDMAVAQPVLFAIQVGLLRLWRSLGIEPQAVIGHSYGEVAAAYAAEVLSLGDAARVIAWRSRMLQSCQGQGGMALLGVSGPEAEELVAGWPGRLAIAAYNGRNATVVSGELTSLYELSERVRARGLAFQPVKIEVPAHSPFMDEGSKRLHAALQGLTPSAPQVPFYSTVLGRRVTRECLDAAYFADNLRQPVRFDAALQALLHDGFRSFVELSPHPLLGPGISQRLADQQCSGLVVASLHREIDERQALLDAAGRLYCAGLDIRWSQLYPDETKLPGSAAAAFLPRYPWQDEPCWFPAALPTKWPQATVPAVPDTAPRHPLLTRHFELATSGDHVFLGRIDRLTAPQLGEHRVAGAALLPAAAFLEMALFAGRQLFPAQTLILEDVRFQHALALPDETSFELQVSLSSVTSNAASFQCATRIVNGDSQSSFTVHATGVVRSEPGEHQSPPVSEDLGAIRARCTAVLAPAELYAQLRALGMELGPSFHGVATAHSGAGEVLAELIYTREVSEEPRYILHPALLDAGLHAAAAARQEQQAPLAPLLPVSLQRLQLFHQAAPIRYSHVKLTSTEVAGAQADVNLLDASGRPLVQLTGLRCQRLAPPPRAAGVASWLYHVAWQTQPRTVVTAPSQAPCWLFTSGTPLDSALVDLLTARQVPHLALLPGIDQDAADPGGYRVDLHSAAALRRLFQEKRPGSSAPARLIFLGSLTAPTSGEDAGLLQAQQSGCLAVTEIVRALLDAWTGTLPYLWLVTRGAQVVAASGLGSDAELAQSPLWGLTRVLRQEYPHLRCTLVDLDPAQPVDEALELLSELDAESVEPEVALRSGSRYVPRLLPLPARPERIATTMTLKATDQAGYALAMTRPGVLADLALIRVPRRAPGPAEVEIEVAAAGLNFSDVMKALGVYPTLDGVPSELGGECSGRIVRLGSGVAGLHLGQKVIAIANNCFRSFVTCPSQFVVPLPSGTSFIAGAALPAAFLTARFALFSCGRLAPGERVLIHSASGGVGLAAIQLCQRLGARIFATAGSEAKRAFLRSLSGVELVMDSRTTDFSAEVLARTAGEGVDVLLNTLPGPSLTRGLAILAPGGRFLEIGKRDIYRGTTIGLRTFANGSSFTAVDLDLVARRQPARIAALLHEVVQELACGQLTPLSTQHYPITSAQAAFERMAQAKHTGKIVLTLDEPTVQVRLDGQAARLRPDGTYLISGGLGGLGLQVARFLVENGARHLVLIGRSEASEGTSAVLAELSATGAVIETHAVDVADAVQLERVLVGITTRGHQLRGVVHAAAVLQDELLLRMTPQSFWAVMRPKVLGGYLLHRLLAAQQLDFFVLFSSASALLGTPGQSSYAAANAFLDALAWSRRQRGQPALSIDWGPWSEVGLAARADLNAQLAAVGFESLRPPEGLAALAELLQADAPQVAVMRLDLRQWQQRFTHAANSPFLSALLQPALAAPAAPSQLWTQLVALLPSQRRAFLEDYICDQIAAVLKLGQGQLHAETALGGLGMDSLMALEVRNRLERALHLALPPTLLWAHPHVAALALHLLTQLELPTVHAPPLAVEIAPESAELLAAFSELPEDDASALLEAVAGALSAELSSAEPQEKV